MKITNVKSDRFAGIKNIDRNFEPNMNIIYGTNESGKSTLVSLINSILFQNASLSKTKDADFLNNFFPNTVGSTQGDIIDGELVFETEDGRYRLQKNWYKAKASSGTTILYMPDRTKISNVDEINEVLSNVLHYQSGVYNNLVFVPQNRKNAALQNIMNAVKATRQKDKDNAAEDMKAILSTLHKASVETGGVPLDKLETELQTRLSELGEGWDMIADEPEKGQKSRVYTERKLPRSAGAIVVDYLDVILAKDKRDKAVELEGKVSGERQIIASLKNIRDEIEERRNRFRAFRDIIVQKNLLSGNVITTLKAEIEEGEKALTRWPELLDGIGKAEKLEEMRAESELNEIYSRVKISRDNYIKAEKALAALKAVDAADVRRLGDLISEKRIEEGRLAGLNIVARVKQLGDVPVEISLISDGSKLSEVGGEYQITDAVDITVPGIMEMQLVPKGIDIEAVKEKIAGYDNDISAIYKNYSVSGEDELKKAYDAYEAAKAVYEKSRTAYESELAKDSKGRSWETLSAEAAKLSGDIKALDDVNREIRSLCGSDNISEYLGGAKNSVLTFEEKFETLDKLKEQVAKKKKEMDGYQKQLDSLAAVPEEFAAVTDPEEYENKLIAESDNNNSEIEKHNNELNELNKQLGNVEPDDFISEIEEKEKKLEADKTEYRHWKNIYDKFIMLKSSMADNPVMDIEKSFSKYLGIISNNQVKLSSMSEKMNVNLESGVNSLSYDTLSPGTMDTVSLAFRLAMLEHLFPEGGGVAVFDDPFSDMDEEREKQSCELLKEFAKNNQVIFLTCDRKYFKLFGVTPAAENMF